MPRGHVTEECYSPPKVRLIKSYSAEAPAAGGWLFRGKSITIFCTDRDRSATFYQNVLGAVPLAGDGYGCRWYRLGDLVFSLVPNAAAGTPASFPRDAMVTMNLEVEDLATAHGRLVDAGVPIIDAPPDGPYLLIADPDGLLIEVFERDEEAGDG